MFYDFLYYLIYKFYSGKEKGASSSAAGIVGGLQAMNVLTVLMALGFFISPKSHFSKVIVIVVFIFFQVTTYIRYIHKENNSIQKVEGRWLKLKEGQKRKIENFALLYIISSVLISFGFAIYIGTTR